MGDGTAVFAQWVTYMEYLKEKRKTVCLAAVWISKGTKQHTQKL